MWNRLESHYQDQGAVLRSLIRDLEDLKLKSEKNRDIVKYVNELEVIYESLYSISPEHPKKVNVNQVDKLAQQLPAEVRTDWNKSYYRLSQEKKESPFQEFLLFCVEQRAIRLRFLEDTAKSDRKSGTHGVYSTEEGREKKTFTKDC